MWDANYGGPMYGFQAYLKAPMMLSMLGGVVGDSAVWDAMSAYAAAWRFKHPSPWDYAFFMDQALHRDLGWFWYSWLFTTDAVDGSIERVRDVGIRTPRSQCGRTGRCPRPSCSPCTSRRRDPRSARWRTPGSWTTPRRS